MSGPQRYVDSDMAAEVREGLSKMQKELPSKYLYDEIGSSLFEVICLLPEYGVTRAGLRLARKHAVELAERMPIPLVVAELGSGSGKKTRFLLEAISRRQPVTYCPIDISRAALVRVEQELRHIDAVSVVGFEGVYLQGLADVAERRRSGGEPLLVLFLGGTIGNFDRPAAERFLVEIRSHLEKDDMLLLTADLLKSPALLVPAYDDSLGVTAAFDKNLLARLNRELHADFDLHKFEHEARWNEAERRIEMHLRALESHVVHLRRLGIRVPFRQGETLWTESSHRFTARELVDMGGRSGFRQNVQWIDQEWPFAMTLFTAY